MKKIKGLILIFLIFLLNSCIITWDYYFEDVNPNDIKTISFYDISEETNKGDSKIILSKEPFYILNENKNYEFFEKLKELDFGDSIIFPAANDPTFRYGDYVVKMTFKDYSFRLISWYGFSEYFNSDGERIGSNNYGCDEEKWNELIFYYVNGE